MEAAQRHSIVLAVAATVLATHACGPAPKVRRLQEQSLGATIRLAKD